jgi:hypothetical protein
VENQNDCGIFFLLFAIFPFAINLNLSIILEIFSKSEEYFPSLFPGKLTIKKCWDWPVLA